MGLKTFFRRATALFVLPFLVGPLLSCSRVHAGQKGEEVRALWVTRWDYRSAEDVKAITRNAAATGFNTLYFQVRGEATCFYPSSVEPWAWELSGKIAQTGKNPGWDPLAVAISQAHAHGLELHAYMNVLPCWNQGVPPPRGSKHVFLEHKDWLMMDPKGRRMDPKALKFYAFLNPAHPEVRKHLVRVFAEVARRYPALDGVHMDYLRYPSEVGDYSYESVTVGAFKKVSGGLSPSKAPKLWVRFRCQQIDGLLRDITGAMRRENPKLEISCAVFANYESAITQKGQRWLLWPDAGLLDTPVPMAYHYDMTTYNKFLDYCLGETKPKRGRVVIGIYPAEKWEKSYGFDMGVMARQIAWARRKGADGVALFSYQRFFPNHKPNAWARYIKANCFGTAP